MVSMRTFSSLCLPSPIYLYTTAILPAILVAFRDSSTDRFTTILLLLLRSYRILVLPAFTTTFFFPH